MARPNWIDNSTTFDPFERRYLRRLGSEGS